MSVEKSSEAPIHLVINAMSTRPGGGLTVLLGVLQGLKSQAAANIKATVVCSADGTRQGVEEQGIAEVKQPMPNAGGIKRQFWVSWSMAKYIAALKPDVFLSINQFISGIKCPQVVYHINLLRFLPIEPGTPFKQKLFERLRNYSAKQALVKCAANVFESAYIQETAAGIHQGNNPNDQVIYIGLPDNLADTQPAPNRTDYDNTQLISITNGNPHKDNTTLVKTLAELVKVRPEVDWKLKIAGGLFSELWDKYKRLAEELGVLERIEWLGFVQQDQLTAHLNHSLCLISTSRIESFCMVALEAMARGCPSIVADCASMPESVGDAGMLAPPGDHESFAKSVIELHDSPKKRSEIAELGFKHIQQFRWDNCGLQFAELFAKLAQANR